MSSVVEEIFNLTEDVMVRQRANATERFNAVNALTCGYIPLYNKLREREPYHINIVDALYINENANSRILGGILKYKIGDRYTILESFLRLAFNRHKFNIQSPTITIEKNRIDVFIRDNEYAVVIENKIYNADDKENQIARYIEIATNYGYSLEHIFVVYMPPTSSKTLSDQSWVSPSGYNYKDEFKSRYAYLTFRESILGWLRSTVHPNIETKDIYLQSAIIQYIDYLEGLFNCRKINASRNMELKEFIKKELGFEESSYLNYNKVNRKLNDIAEVQKQLESIKYEVIDKSFAEWQRLLYRDFSHLRIVCTDRASGYPKVGVIVPSKAGDVSVLLEYSTKTSKIYYGISCKLASEKNDKIRTQVQDILYNIYSKGETENWYGWTLTSFENGYTRLSNLINECLRHLRS